MALPEQVADICTLHHWVTGKRATATHRDVWLDLPPKVAGAVIDGYEAELRDMGHEEVREAITEFLGAFERISHALNWAMHHVHDWDAPAVVGRFAEGGHATTEVWRWLAAKRRQSRVRG